MCGLARMVGLEAGAHTVSTAPPLLNTQVPDIYKAGGNTAISTADHLCAKGVFSNSMTLAITLPLSIHS
jgi:hypothetical protein